MHVNAPKNSRLLIFDLDETLVHCFEDNESGHAENCDAHTVEIKTRDGDILSA
jgi:predicted HAD superfamily phosphohydrolase YqeG